MKLASKEAIGFMLDGEVLIDDEGGKVWYCDTERFRYQYMDTQPEPIDKAWTTSGWELQKKYKPIPKEWTNDWANYRSVDKDGELWEYVKKPRAGNDTWGILIGNYKQIPGLYDPTNWENSLEEREREPEEPTISDRLSRIEKHLGLS
jgi:hypothetical protein